MKDRLEIFEGKPVLRIHFRVEAAKGASATRVEAFAKVAINDGAASEKEPPIAGSSPEIVGYWSPSNVNKGDCDVVIDSTDEGEWSVVVSVPEDVAVSVVLKAAEVPE